MPPAALIVRIHERGALVKVRHAGRSSPVRSEALKRLDAGDSVRSIAKSFNVHHATVLKVFGAGADSHDADVYSTHRRWVCRANIEYRR
jgi:hypothetical protein